MLDNHLKTVWLKTDWWKPEDLSQRNKRIASLGKSDRGTDRQRLWFLELLFFLCSQKSTVNLIFFHTSCLARSRNLILIFSVSCILKEKKWIKMFLKSIKCKQTTVRYLYMTKFICFPKLFVKSSSSFLCLPPKLSSPLHQPKFICK